MPYSAAITRLVPNSFENCVTNVDNSAQPIDIKLAQKQHDAYVDILKKYIPNVIVVEADENHPDCSFVEDTATVFGNVAVIDQPGHPSRRNEVPAIENALKQIPSIQTIIKMEDMDKEALLDGGDVLNTGAHIFVGLSDRTNIKGGEVLQKAFDGLVKTFIMETPDEMLHLKCGITALEDTKTLIAVDYARPIVMEMNRLTDNHYNVIYVPDLVAANVLSANGLLLIQEGFPKSEQVLREHFKSLDIVALNMSEIIKADGALTCGSILIK
ncbi:uncharacterized protein BX664DRAFT_382492 [Halteromyces radiatus]|uniref:uncharacterized protein n=1 Tax=Halteromyces radiatus TaxID=101107 RepID=UPI0022211E80|nr:uncharacterized protein BX664DRAFT_382492 [Halteromyces radiatus]KAI8100050.1 hypothetical protein BX664DRAFT_382492 [Halteromyces radiatus]